MDWQIVGTADATTYETGDSKVREIRGRLKALEARAFNTPGAAVTDPAAVVARRSLVNSNTNGGKA